MERLVPLLPATMQRHAAAAGVTTVRYLTASCFGVPLACLGPTRALRVQAEVGGDAHRELLSCRDTAEAARVTSPG
jgi:hypothetical protein